MTAVEVRCHRAPTDGWACEVRVLDGATTLTTHEVRVQAADLARLAPGSDDPTELVERSFGFLLEREPPGSILRAFDLPAIGRYFPEYESAIRRSERRG